MDFPSSLNKLQKLQRFQQLPSLVIIFPRAILLCYQNKKNKFIITSFGGVFSFYSINY